MQKIAIITDSASDLPQEFRNKENVFVLNFQVVYKDRTYTDGVDIQSKEVLENLGQEVPTTSLPVLEEIHEVFRTIESKGYTQVLVIPISSNLSGCFGAIAMVKQDYPNLDTHMFDSLTISVGEGALVIEAIKMSESFEEIGTIEEKLGIMRSKQHTFFIVDTLKYLIAGGRIGHVSGAIGSLLNLKPIISVGDDGKYVSYMKVRGHKKALSTFIEETKKILAQTQGDIYIVHGDGEQSAQHLYDELKGEATLGKIESWGWISTVSCVHTGPGLIALLLQEK